MMKKNMLLKIIWILMDRLIMAILNQVFISQDLEDNKWATPNLLVNKDIIYNNHQTWINPQCTDNFLDSHKYNQAMANL